MYVLFFSVFRLYSYFSLIICFTKLLLCMYNSVYVLMPFKNICYGLLIGLWAILWIKLRKNGTNNMRSTMAVNECRNLSTPIILIKDFNSKFDIYNVLSMPVYLCFSNFIFTPLLLVESSWIIDHACRTCLGRIANK